MMNRRWYDRRTLPSIIRRAHEIDESQSDRLSADDVRQIAEDLDISAESVELALREANAPSISDNRQSSMKVGTAAVLAGMACGLTVSVVGGYLGSDALGALPVVKIVLLINVITAAKVSGRFKLAKYQAINVGTWAACGLGVLPLFYALDSAAVGALVGAVVGSVIIVGRSIAKGRAGAASVEELEGLKNAKRTWYARALSRLNEIIRKLDLATRVCAMQPAEHTADN